MNSIVRKGIKSDVPNRLFIFMGGILGLVLLMLVVLVTIGPPIHWLGEIGGLPIHPLVVHATVVAVVVATLSTIALAAREKWRHKYGHLLFWTLVIMLVTTWIAVESGAILTAVPGLGSTAHAAGGELLLAMQVPFALISYAMIVWDKHVLRHLDEPEVWQRRLLVAICILAVIAAVLVLGQTIIVGHSGAVASWGGTFT